MVLDIRGKATCISWYEIWEAVLAVVSNVCSRIEETLSRSVSTTVSIKP